MRKFLLYKDKVYFFLFFDNFHVRIILFSAHKHQHIQLFAQHLPLMPPRRTAVLNHLFFIEIAALTCARIPRRASWQSLFYRATIVCRNRFFNSHFMRNNEYWNWCRIAQNIKRISNTTIFFAPIANMLQYSIICRWLYRGICIRHFMRITINLW